MKHSGASGSGGASRPGRGKRGGRGGGGSHGGGGGRRRRGGSGGGSPSAREAALDVFLAWDTSRDSADRLLGPALDDARLDGRDRDLAAELVRGVFRWRGRLDWQLSHLANRPIDDLDRPIRWIQRLGLHQLENLDRIPVHAAVYT